MRVAAESLRSRGSITGLGLKIIVVNGIFFIIIYLVPSKPNENKGENNEYYSPSHRGAGNYSNLRRVVV